VRGICHPPFNRCKLTDSRILGLAELHVERALEGCRTTGIRTRRVRAKMHLAMPSAPGRNAVDAAYRASKSILCRMIGPLARAKACIELSCLDCPQSTKPESQLL